MTVQERFDKLLKAMLKGEPPKRKVEAERPHSGEKRPKQD